MVALKSADIEKFVARPDAARPVVLIFGADAGLVRERAEKIIKASIDSPDDPFSLVRLEGDELSGDAGRLLDEANTIPLFGGRRAVWVKAGGRNIAPAVEALLASPPTDCRVVIEAGDLKRGAALRNVCERAKLAVAIPCYADGDRDVGRLIDDEMRAAELKISPDAREALIPLLGGDRRASRAELRKLALYARGQARVELDDILAVVADASALGFDTLIDAAFAGDITDVEKEFSKAMIAGTAPVAIVGAALRQIERLHVMRLTVESGSSAGAVVEQAGIHFRRKGAVEKALKGWTSDRLAKAMAMLGQTSFEVRLHSGLAETIAQRALMLIARSAAQRS